MSDAVQDDDRPADDEDRPAEEELAEAPRRGRLALTVAAVLGVLAVGFIWVLVTSDDSTDRLAYSPLVGEQAPALSGESLLTGESFDIGDHRGKWVVVNFFATWCTPCIQEHPELVAFDDAYGTRGDAAVVSVVFDDNPEEVTDFFSARGGDWPVIPDPDARIAVDYGVLKVPETYLVDPDGIVRRKLIGGVSQDGLERHISSLETEAVETEAEGAA